MSKIINFAFRIKAEESNLTLYDGTTASTKDLTVPAGDYSYPDFITLVNTIISSYGSFDILNDRQLQLDFIHVSSTITIPDTDDQQLICEALGLYDNSGGVSRTWAIDEITQITATSWFINSCGFLYLPYDENGFPDFGAEHFNAESGAVAVITGQRKSYFDPQLTYIDGELVSGSFALGTQAVIGVTPNPTDSVGLWKAYDPTTREPGKVYMETEDNGDNWYYIRSPITPDDVQQAVTNQSIYYNISLYLTKVL